MKKPFLFLFSVLFVLSIFQGSVMAEESTIPEGSTKPEVKLTKEVTASSTEVHLTVVNYKKLVEENPEYSDLLYVYVGEDSYSADIEGEQVTIEIDESRKEGTVMNVSYVYYGIGEMPLFSFKVAKGKPPYFKLPKTVDLEEPYFQIDKDDITSEDKFYAYVKGKRFKAKDEFFYHQFRFSGLVKNDVVEIVYEMENGTRFNLAKIPVVNKIAETRRPSLDDLYQEEITIRDTQVKGKGMEPGLKVAVVANKKTYKGTVTSKGTYTVNIPTQKQKTSITTYFTSKYGTKSYYYYDKVVFEPDLVDFENISMKDVTVRSTTISGKVFNYREGDIIELQMGKKKYKVKIAKNKTFSQKIAKQKVNTKVYFTNKDRLGQTLYKTHLRVYTTLDVKIGMTKKEVLNTAWGEPNDINKTTTKYGTREQWVYDEVAYLYFNEKGKLTTISDY